MIDALNGSFVSIFGIILSFSFCSIVWTKKKYVQMAACTVGLLLMQGIVYVVFGYEMVQKLYPILIHVPLATVLWFFTREGLWSLTSVFVAYLCCDLRRWLALLIVAVSRGFMAQNIAELLITVPVLLLLIKFSMQDMPRREGLHRYPSVLF